MMRPSSCRRLCWTTWKRMLRPMLHWWWVYIRLQVVTLNTVLWDTVMYKVSCVCQMSMKVKNIKL